MPHSRHRIFLVLPRRRSGGPGSAASSAILQPFLGRWDITITTALTRDSLLARSLRAARRPQSHNDWSLGQRSSPPSGFCLERSLTFVDPKDEEGAKSDMIFHATLKNGKLVGDANGPAGAPWTWVAVRAPSLMRSGAPRWGAPISLFDGKNLYSWHEYQSRLLPAARPLDRR